MRTTTTSLRLLERWHQCGSWVFIYSRRRFITNQDEVFVANDTLFKSSGFQAQVGVFLFFCRFDTEIILWLFVDYGEKYALLLHLDRFHWFYRCSTSKNIFWRKSQPRVHPFKSVFNIFFEFRKFRPQYFYIKYILIKKNVYYKSRQSFLNYKWRQVYSKLRQPLQITIRAVFKWLSKNQNENNYSDQSQQEQTARWTNHNS